MPDDDLQFRDPEVLASVVRLTRDLRDAAITLTDAEARFLVDYYYITQEDRKRAKGQERDLLKANEPHSLISWLATQTSTLEKQVRAAIDAYTTHHPMGDWMRGIYGIGPVITAGLLANIDIHKAPTVGHIWAFAGLAADGQKPWIKKTKRPWNASLKTLCWKTGDSFVKFSNEDQCYYGKIYRERKALEVSRNEAGLFKHIADKKLAQPINKDRPNKERKPYHEKGILSPGHLDLRARRYAVKLFLSHLHDEWWRRATGTEPPLPYPIAILGHGHFIPGP